MMLDLLTQRRVRFGSYHAAFDRDYRSFQRDLSQLRKIGEEHGFEISNIKNGEYAELIKLKPVAARLNRDASRLEHLLTAMAQAMGTPIVREFGSRLVTDAADDEFFSFIGPKLAHGTFVADICSTLREASLNPMGRARVVFRYPDADRRTASEREVEPYRVIVRSGQFYLLGYDCGRKGWRIFAIDRFLSKPRKSGGCLKTREIPAEYLSEDTIGFFRGRERVDVTVELSARVASSATARQWQAGQRVEVLEDGRAQITFAVSDVDEVIRWALGYGSDATVIAPPVAVERAAAMTAAIAAKYGPATTARRFSPVR
jgi:hypothetical protein